MFGLIPRKRSLTEAIAGDGGALAPFGFPLFRSALFPEFDRLFEGFFRDVEMPEIVRRVEIEEKPTEIVVRAEAPGFKPEEFTIELREEMLILRALKEKKPEVKVKEEPKDEKKEEMKEKEEKKEVKEYLREEFYEELMLPAPVIAEKVAAKLVNGVLIVTLPKKEEVVGRTVPVTLG